MTCKGCNTNFCYDCGVKTPHPAGSTCVHARAGVHGERNNNQMNVYNRPVPNNIQERNRPGGERMNNPIIMPDEQIPNNNQERNRPHIEQRNNPINRCDNQACHRIKDCLETVAFMPLIIVAVVLLSMVVTVILIGEYICYYCNETNYPGHG